MGLDQSLVKRKRGRGKPKREEIMYWRKANQIHKWFLDNVVPEDKKENFNADYAEVSKEQLEQLKEVCEKVLSKSKLVKGKVVTSYTYNDDGTVKPVKGIGKKILFKRTAKKYLPTMEGFFFGSTDYDEYYLSGVEDTRDMLERILKEIDFNDYIVEYNCWW